MSSAKLNRCYSVALMLVAGCAGSTRGLGVQGGEITKPQYRVAGESPVEFHYLGTGGWIIRRGEDVVMTAPFFSNPGFFRVAFFPIAPNLDRVQRHLDRTPYLDRISIVLAGHSHYDHLLDIALVFKRLPQSARLFSGLTTVNLLRAELDGRVESVLGRAGTQRSAGEWITQGRIRFLPMLSEHAAHSVGVKFYNGHETKPPYRIPRRAGDWVEGEPLAFLIDFLHEDGTIDFRVYYDDAAHNSPYGFPDRATRDQHRVDVAIVCAASFHQVDDYPDALLAYLSPRHVLIGHWEDFFISPDAPAKTVRLTNVRQFIDRVRQSIPKDGDWSILDRHAVVRFIGPGQ